MKTRPLTLFTIGIALNALLTACGLNKAITFEPADVHLAAAQIAEITPPPGYTPEFSGSLGKLSIAAFQGDTESSHLYLIQSKDPDHDLSEVDFGGLLPGSYNQVSHTTVIETRPVVVRGQDVTLLISEGVNGNGVPYRQMAVQFLGLEGSAMLVLSEPTSQWDDQAVEHLLDSIQ